jgi:EAL domain-containing protein (putative c-di-GMP-specific phosphodiesterase class I)
MGYREVQGYHYARPLLPDEVAPLLRRGLKKLTDGT